MSDDDEHAQALARVRAALAETRATFAPHSTLRLQPTKALADGADWMMAVIEFAEFMGLLPCWSDTEHDNEIVFHPPHLPCRLCTLTQGR